MDLLAGAGAGGADEAEAQHAMLKFECNPDGSAKQVPSSPWCIRSRHRNRSARGTLI